MSTKRTRLWTLIAVALMLWTLGAAAASGPEAYDAADPSALTEDQLWAESALLFDMDTGETLLSKNSRVRMFPASTTKIMTLLLALESGRSLDETVTIPREADDVPQGSSVIGIRSGDAMTWRDLLYGFMLQSGNDGSNAIAVLTSGSIDAFVKRMNERAAQLNCEGTHYTNAHGYHDPNHYTTAQDLARIAMAAMRDETFRDIVAMPRWSVTVTRGGKTGSKEMENRNSLVVPESNYYYEGATGVKTGHHNKAGWCVVATAERSDVRLMAVVLNCATEDRKWQDARRLFDYGFSRYEAVTMETLLDRLDSEIGQATFENAADSDPQGGRMTLDLELLEGGGATRMIQRDSEKALDRALNDIRAGMTVAWSRPLTAPVQAGEVVGTLRFDAPDGTPVSARLTASRTVEARPAPTATPVAQTGDAPRGGGKTVILPALALILGVAAGGLALLRARAQKTRARRRRRTSTARRRGSASSGGRTGARKGRRENGRARPRQKEPGRGRTAGRGR